MVDNYYWNEFYRSGSIYSYLSYKMIQTVRNLESD